VGLLTSWGGSITEVSLNGVNYVNANDPGREVQAELWDGNTPDLSMPGFWGPVQAGDHDYNGSPVLTQTVSPDSIYIKTQPLHWIPEYFGGGSGNPVPSDVYIEQWLTPYPVTAEPLGSTTRSLTSALTRTPMPVKNILRSISIVVSTPSCTTAVRIPGLTMPYRRSLCLTCLSKDPCSPRRNDGRHMWTTAIPESPCTLRDHSRGPTDSMHPVIRQTAQITSSPRHRLRGLPGQYSNRTSM
jgi:hypothetical protein